MGKCCYGCEANVRKMCDVRIVWRDSTLESTSRQAEVE